MGEAVQNIDPKRERSLANLIPIKPGQTLNPGGRPFSLMRLARDKTNDGVELIDFALSVMRGECPGAKVGDKIECMKFLAERGWGKPIQPIITKDDGKPPKNYGNLTDQEFKIYADLWTKLHLQDPTIPTL